MSIRTLIDYAWVGVGIIWLLAASRTKQAVRQYGGPARTMQMVLLVAAFLLVFYRSVPMGVFDLRVIPRTSATEVVGVAVTLVGLLFALWARFFLGMNWSSEITVKQDHQLVRRGPYAVVRHPIYSGFLLALLGTAFAFGQIRCFAGFVLAAIGWKLKSRVEERFMTEQFGAEYTTYKRDVKALVPFIW